MRSRPAVFLDRDGTVTVERGYVTRPEDLDLIPGAAAAIRSLNRAGVLAVLVSNQSGVARGLMTEEDLARVHERLVELLASGGARLDGAYYCTSFAGAADPKHRRDLGSRKPEPGMVDRALSELPVDLSSSAVVGDSWVDLELARRVGAAGVLVLTGKGRTDIGTARELGIPIAHVAPDLREAVDWVLSRAPRAGAPKGEA